MLLPPRIGMVEPLHHYHRRSRIFGKHERIPSRDKWKARMDKVIYGVGLLGPAMMIPQLFEIFSKKSAEEFSPISWTFFTFYSLFWLAYGILHREKPIIITYIAWFFIHVLIVLGIVWYG